MADKLVVKGNRNQGFMLFYDWHLIRYYEEEREAMIAYDAAAKLLKIQQNDA